MLLKNNMTVVYSGTKKIRVGNLLLIRTQREKIETPPCLRPHRYSAGTLHQQQVAPHLHVLLWSLRASAGAGLALSRAHMQKRYVPGDFDDRILAFVVRTAIIHAHAWSLSLPSTLYTMSAFVALLLPDSFLGLACVLLLPECW